MPRMQIPKKLRPFIGTPKRFKIAIGGRGSGKSMSFADMCLMDAQTKGIKTACFREFQNSIDDSVHALLKSEIERLELQGFEVQNNQILLNQEPVFKFRGLARNPEGVKSMHGFQRFWVEEAQTISFNSLKALTPTLREEGSEILFSANPRSSVDAFSQRFIKPFEKQLRRDGYYEDDLQRS
jgi:phage terminase large subunit